MHSFGIGVVVVVVVVVVVIIVAAVAAVAAVAVVAAAAATAAAAAAAAVVVVVQGIESWISNSFRHVCSHIVNIFKVGSLKNTSFSRPEFFLSRLGRFQ